ncbi:MAG: FAD-dependent oxidoreductase [Myxococcota bacterium]
MTVSAERRIAIIGAGMSGLICAEALQSEGCRVVVFDKARGPGGRMSTRRVPELGEGVGFDHGAQYFTVRSPTFAEAVEHWVHEGITAPWDGDVVAIGPEGITRSERHTVRYVGVPGMNGICRRLARSLDVRFGVRVAPVEHDGSGWALEDDQGQPLGGYDLVLCTAPAEQTAVLLGAAAPEIARAAEGVAMQPCWAVLASFDDRLAVHFDAAFVNRGPLSWVARTSSKPARNSSPDRWVLHAGAEWSTAHLEADAADVSRLLLTAFHEALDLPPRDPTWHTAHRWRFAIADAPLDAEVLYDPTLRVGAAGDWTHGNRVEGAFLSGVALARRVLEGTS